MVVIFYQRWFRRDDATTLSIFYRRHTEDVKSNFVISNFLIIFVILYIFTEVYQVCKQFRIVQTPVSHNSINYRGRLLFCHSLLCSVQYLDIKYTMYIFTPGECAFFVKYPSAPRCVEVMKSDERTFSDEWWCERWSAARVEVMKKVRSDVNAWAHRRERCGEVRTHTDVQMCEVMRHHTGDFKNKCARV